MASYTFSSLRDMLKPPPSHNSKLMESLSSHPIPNIEVSHEDPHVIEIFGELYFKETSSSTLNFLSPPPSPSSSQPPPKPQLSSSPLPNHTLQTSTTEKLNDKTNLEMEKSRKVEKNGCIYNKRLWGNKERLFPPPISCLKSAKSTGKPLVYFRFDEKSSSFVREVIRTPSQGLLRASRERAHLRLNFVHNEGEEDGQEANDH
ncbi:ABC transporter G family member protein [Actinidia chinensis var. chinensis]|uniref:ABC transporter G family member protein n=1 Tax=Actinidia chinensis var. chinensis TaxID=1590841 RepID=A0A2R6PW49_ACTCC|nr:ABC transporter G family member protein [Actinidia chinensis var. chinensis]